MAYRWHYSSESGVAATGPECDFAEQSAAEDWLGAHWAALLDAGVSQVTLLDGDTEVYGPMSLHPPED